jgi:hypothetical protein
VLLLLDKDGDEKVSPEEFETVGLDGLPNFEGMGADGHHYDVESGLLECLVLITYQTNLILLQNSSFIMKVPLYLS